MARNAAELRDTMIDALLNLIVMRSDQPIWSVEYVHATDHDRAQPQVNCKACTILKSFNFGLQKEDFELRWTLPDNGKIVETLKSLKNEFFRYSPRALENHLRVFSLYLKDLRLSVHPRLMLDRLEKAASTTTKILNTMLELYHQLLGRHAYPHPEIAWDINTDRSHIIPDTDKYEWLAETERFNGAMTELRLIAETSPTIESTGAEMPSAQSQHLKWLSTETAFAELFVKLREKGFIDGNSDSEVLRKAACFFDNVNPREKTLKQAIKNTEIRKAESPFANIGDPPKPKSRRNTPRRPAEK